MVENKAGLSEQEVEEFRQLLLEKRKELSDDLQGLSTELESEKDPNDLGGGLSKMPTHPADVGTDLYEQELSAKNIVRHKNRMQEITDALARIEAGTYGLCEGTGKPIERRRLQAAPWARYSKEHAERVEAKAARVAVRGE